MLLKIKVSISAHHQTYDTNEGLGHIGSNRIVCCLEDISMGLMFLNLPYISQLMKHRARRLQLVSDAYNRIIRIVEPKCEHILRATCS